MWTIDKVKAELPKVKAEIVEEKPNGKKIKRVIEGQVSGRRRRFPSVWVKYQGNHLEWEFAWGTIANSLNKDKPLKV